MGQDVLPNCVVIYILVGTEALRERQAHACAKAHNPLAFCVGSIDINTTHPVHKSTYICSDN